MPATQSWESWYDETVNALVAAIESANVEWATRADGTPWVVVGQRRPRGIEYPHAMILRFTKQIDDAESMRQNELHRISSSVSVFREGDSTTPQANLKAALSDMAKIEDSLYADRSLGGSCELVTITQSDAFEMETAQGHETVGDVQLTITKRAHLSH